MRRLAGGLLLAALLALLILPPAAAAGTPIPNTNVQVFALGPSTKTVAPGATASFARAVVNAGPSSYQLRVTATSSDASFALSVSPAAFLINRDGLVEVAVNVTAPPDRGTRTATVRVLFETRSPIASSLPLDVSVTARTTPASLGTLTAFLVVAAIIAIGFAAALVFERTRIPDIIILIVLGLILGPLSLGYLGVSVITAGALEAATPYFTALALMFILFDGGLNLRLGPVVRKLGLIGLHTGLTFALTVVTIALVSIHVLGFDPLVGLLFGGILAGTSSAVVIGVTRQLRVGEETKILLILESVLTDVLCVVLVLAIIELLRGGPGASPSIAVVGLGRAFLVSSVYGFVLGLWWLVLLRRVGTKPFAYMLTIGALLALYAVSELSGGSGAMASFVFGLVLGNHALIGRRLGLKTRFVVDERIRQFHGELSFMIRTFFFVFLGVVFTLDLTGRWSVSTGIPGLVGLSGTFALFIAGVVLVFLGMLGVRIFTARLVSYLRGKPPVERQVLWSVMGQGLAAVVLASLPFTIPAFVSPATPGDVYYRTLIAPYESLFLNAVLLVIFLTVATTTIGVFVCERGLGRALPARTQPEIRREFEGLLVSELEDFIAEEGAAKQQEPTPPGD